MKIKTLKLYTLSMPELKRLLFLYAQAAKELPPENGKAQEILIQDTLKQVANETENA